MSERSTITGMEPQPPVFTVATQPWQDTARTPDERAADLLGRMTLEEKVAQLWGVWIGATTTDGEMAPHQHEMSSDDKPWAELIAHGLGQITRPFGTAPVEAGTGVGALALLQSQIVAASRFGVPAVAHEECLTGLMTHGATVYPTPLAWGASFDHDLVARMAEQIGQAMRQLGVHQGLAPVLDVVRDPRWGRTEETIGEDPYLVATVGTAYVRGLQTAGIIATLKHFAGYSASRAGRNFAPVSVGPREFADVILPPFEMAVRAGARSVMHSYAEIDGVPAAANVELLTDLLRDTWGFTGTLVADYFGVSFLERMHLIAGSTGEAAALALAAGLDVELPSVRCYAEPLIEAVRARAVPESLIDRAAGRVLRQKCELGMLDPGWTPEGDAADGPFDLDRPEYREVARELAEESVVLLANDGTLPLATEPVSSGLTSEARREDGTSSGSVARADGVGARIIALVGPLADDTDGMLGCYTFPSHVATQYQDAPEGVTIPTLATALRAELPDATITYALGCGVDSADRAGFADAVSAATDADVCVVVLGDRAGLFGKGTSGEGSDAADLALPGVQGDLLEELLGTGTPVVAVVLAGRCYALGPYADRLAGVVQAFFPGQEGGSAVAGVLSGRVNPSGRLPLSAPRLAGGQPNTYLTPKLGGATEVSSVDPTPLYPFGYGLSYTSFAWSDVTTSAAEIDTDGTVEVGVTVRNTGDRAGTEIVQLYLHDPVAQVTRPTVRLIGYTRVPLAAGAAATVRFRVHADLSSFTGLTRQRVVEPGDLELRLATSSDDARHTVAVTLVGPTRIVDHHRVLTSDVAVEPLRSA